MKLLRLILISIFLFVFIAACTKENEIKRKKGDFLFRKCSSCEKVIF